MPTRVNCKFRKTVNGNLKEIPPQDMEGQSVEGNCVFKIHDLFEARNKLVRLIAYEFLVEGFESVVMKRYLFSY